MSLPTSEDSIRQFLQHRKSVVRSLPTDNAASRQTFSFENPHRCSYCARIFLDGCAYTSGITLFNLNTSLTEAIEASRDGCHFFDWLVDICADNFSPRNDFSYSEGQLQLEFPNQPRIAGTSWFTTLLLTYPGKGSYYAGSYDYAGRLFFCAKSDNPAATCVLTRPHKLDLQSQITAQFARDCLEECQTTHDMCRLDLTKPHSGTEVLDKADLPTRLLEISSPNADSIRLIEPAKLQSLELDHIANDGFVALSYCWGGDQPVKLTCDTAQTLKNGIATSSLPQTLSDAIKQTSVLVMKYIWIDALCITQDDDFEKGLEIARLPSYYHRNSATICAASAESCASGFLGTSNLVFRAGPFEIAMKTPKGMGSVLFYDTLTPYQPTTFRAWTLQESLLSRRLLIFGSDRLVWCCLAANAGCGGPEAAMTARNMGVPQSLVSGIFPLTVLETLPARSQWDKVVQDYTRRKLTNTSDKLLAVAAAASTILTMSRVREQENSIYLAGLLTIVDDSKVMSDALGWLTVRPTATRIKTYTAPSWSWACIDGDIASEPGYSRLKTTSSFRGLERTVHRFQVIQYEVTPIVPAAPCGAVGSGFLKIRGPVWLLDSIQNIPVVTEESPTGLVSRVAPGECCMTIFPDTKGDEELIAGRIGSRKPELFLLELNFERAKDGTMSSGLILSLHEDSQNTFRRVGAFRYEANGRHDDPILRDVLLSPNAEREVILI
ncbi:heterokaryon incompatibility protein-domain-containing protein [Ilyonectria sp. MPI-CAGE-AT-0026]|nr:heterokaryon incompatibility protein-domain-containing protein [Ilyonectria sp. MPI-CAGE-AT-0026]